MNTNNYKQPSIRDRIHNLQLDHLVNPQLSRRKRSISPVRSLAEDKMDADFVANSDHSYDLPEQQPEDRTTAQSPATSTTATIPKSSIPASHTGENMSREHDEESERSQLSEPPLPPRPRLVVLLPENTKDLNVDSMGDEDFEILDCQFEAESESNNIPIEQKNSQVKSTNHPSPHSKSDEPPMQTKSAKPQLDILQKIDKDINILLLGETGVGKSTWINGFINFLKYDSLAEAEAGELITLIPSMFTVCDENYDEIPVITGSDGNEETVTGQSATQKARIYPFDIGNAIIRLIDTPGIGDTRGIDQDRKNFQNILSTLSHLNEIHAICILLKPNNARITLMFRFCIQELLTYLHRDASKNIMFCFTNSRGTFYRPGDTMPALKKLLQGKNAQINVNPKTVYCFDSEAYRFLAAVKNVQKVNFPDDERGNFAQSWGKSTAETKRMLEQIRDLEPHPIQSTLNLNHSRELVLKMVRPMAEITRNNQINKSIVEDEKRDIERTNANINELEKKRMTTRTEIQNIPLNYPKTVCSNSACVATRTIDGKVFTEYVTTCHDQCGLGDDVQRDSIGDPGLMGCTAMQRTEYCCVGKCRHRYTEHLHIYYNSVQVLVKVEDLSVKESIAKKMTAAQMKQNMIHNKDREIKEYEHELKEIEKASVRFAYFLKMNAITPYNDAMEMYLKHLIKEENDKIGSGGNTKTLDSLQASLSSYLLEKNVLDQSMAKGQGAPPTAVEVNQLVKKLKSLRHSGPVLGTALDYGNRSWSNAYVEQPVISVRSRFMEAASIIVSGMAAAGKKMRSWF